MYCLRPLLTPKVKAVEKKAKMNDMHLFTLFLELLIYSLMLTKVNTAIKN
jgi:hypothetical protein